MPLRALAPALSLALATGGVTLTAAPATAAPAVSGDRAGAPATGPLDGILDPVTDLLSALIAVGNSDGQAAFVQRVRVRYEALGAVPGEIGGLLDRLEGGEPPPDDDEAGAGGDTGDEESAGE